MATGNRRIRHTNIDLAGEYWHLNGRVKKCSTCREYKHFKYFENSEAICIKCKRARELKLDGRSKNTKMMSVIQKRVLAAMRRVFNRDRDIEEPNITVMYMVYIYMQQGGLCAMTGRKLTLGTWKEGQPDPDALSIDRIDSSRGYIKGNVRFVTYQANIAKGRFTDKQFYQFCQDAVNFKDAPRKDLAFPLAEVLEKEGLPLPPSLDSFHVDVAGSADRTAISPKRASK